MKTTFGPIGIQVKDVQKSMNFYMKLLGLKIVGKGKLEQTRGEWIELAKKANDFITYIYNGEIKNKPLNWEINV